MLKYSLLTEKVLINSRVYNCYGVVASNGDSYTGLTFSEHQAKELVKSLNEEKVEPCHFKDIIDDFLAKHSTTQQRYLE